MNCGVGRRCCVAVAVAQAAVAWSQPLAWEPPYAAGAAQEIVTTTTTKDKKIKKKINKTRASDIRD